MATTRPNWRTTRARMTKLRVRRIDLVPAGANPESHIVVAKAAAPPVPDAASVRTFLRMKQLDVNPAAVLAELKTPGSSDDPKVAAAAKQFRQSRTAVTASKEENPMPIPEALTELSAEDVDAIGSYVTDLAAELEAERARADAAAEALAKAAAEHEKEEEDPDAVLKGLDPAIVARITKAEAAAAEATEKADRIEKAERQRVFKTRAASMVTLTGGDEGADRLGAILDKAEGSLDADDYAELERTLVAADKQLTTADDLFKSRGSDGEGSGVGAEFVETVKARAAELEKSGMDVIEALRTARREHADLASDYDSNVRNGVR